jgi:hypothetical protein
MKTDDANLFPLVESPPHLSKDFMNIHIGPDLPLGCGLHADRVEHLYRTTSPLLAYLKPWGGEFVLVIRDGLILGMVRRDKRPVWQKLKERTCLFTERHFPKKGETPAEEADASLADCCA